MFSIYADVFRIATFQDDRHADRRKRREEARAAREFERLTGHLDPHLRRDIGLE